MTQAKALVCVVTCQCTRKKILMQPAPTSKPQSLAKQKNEKYVIQFKSHINLIFFNVSLLCHISSHSLFSLCNLELITHLFDIKQLNEMQVVGRGDRSVSPVSNVHS